MHGTTGRFSELFNIQQVVKVLYYGIYNVFIDTFIKNPCGDVRGGLIGDVDVYILLYTKDAVLF